jgi:hypothetical protein
MAERTGDSTNRHDYAREPLIVYLFAWKPPFTSSDMTLQMFRTYITDHPILYCCHRRVGDLLALSEAPVAGLCIQQFEQPLCSLTFRYDNLLRHIYIYAFTIFLIMGWAIQVLICKLSFYTSFHYSDNQLLKLLGYSDIRQLGSVRIFEDNTPLKGRGPGVVLRS